jgi:hypothetical protein
MKIVHKLEIEMSFLVLLKDICIKPIAHMILNGVSVNASFQDQEHSKSVSSHYFYSTLSWSIYAMQWGKKEKETIFKKKNYHFDNNPIVYVADPIKSTIIKSLL